MTTHPSLFQSPFLISFFLCVIFTVTVDAESNPVHNPVDRSLLAAQIGAIVGGYVFFVSVLLALLLSAGRRLRRRRINSSDYTSDLRMMKLSKAAGGLDSTVSSPDRHRSLIWSWSSFKGSKSRISNVSEVTFDDSVVAADRQRAQEQMADLYAAVMEHDTKRAAGIDDSVDGFKYPSSQPSNPFDTPVSQRGGPFSMHNQSRRCPLLSPFTDQLLARRSSPTGFALPHSSLPRSCPSRLHYHLRNTTRRNLYR